MTQGELTVQAAGDRPTLAAWLTTERVAYGAVAGLALFLRFSLGLQPLSPMEAAQALPAWQAAQGNAYQLSGISPLLFGLQRFLFMPPAGSDTVARWWPALAGRLAVLLFYALRDRLGAAELWRPRCCGQGRRSSCLWAGKAPVTGWCRRSHWLCWSGSAWLCVRSNRARWQCLRSHGARSRTDAALLSEGSAETADGRPASGSIRAPLIWAAIALGMLLAAGSGAYTVLLIALVAALLWPGVAARLAAALRGHGRAVLLAGALSFVLRRDGSVLRPCRPCRRPVICLAVGCVASCLG